jgi:hypothetical protein
MRRRARRGKTHPGEDEHRTAEHGHDDTTLTIVFALHTRPLGAYANSDAASQYTVGPTDGNDRSDPQAIADVRVDELAELNE